VRQRKITFSSRFCYFIPLLYLLHFKYSFLRCCAANWRIYDHFQLSLLHFFALTDGIYFLTIKAINFLFFYALESSSFVNQTQA